MSAAEEARKLLEGITPGPWEAEPWDGTTRESVGVFAGSVWGPRVAGLITSSADAEFIAATPELVPALLAELDQAKADLDAAAYRHGQLQSRIANRDATIQRVRELIAEWSWTEHHHDEPVYEIWKPLARIVGGES
ncbi:hypothetical protein [Gordonia westfalica]|uniref:Uncharacterized protein n=1 Tax=Gordonia westfalica TaxID=158898 RepID=A0A1H2DNR4_9ACTN|nr:hypothetical protein [Gordonia westfalica]SDT84458.1 hypothetical protein SAMN04488548_1096 [Gordonia westfalica]SDT84479.1 hypothetical protein SAMN04488548_10917 [Gordonia westfalica]SDT84509.1 hypothetical protein SAMN04488548_10933 [Gordonia westfalica]SDT85853.1 hypothetical protein SAMN04488548_1219 [Gordonia westfalica]SDT85869.1 hypothetical protein SAMN04488548_12112 [Gordonia westfalica]